MLNTAQSWWVVVLLAGSESSAGGAVGAVIGILVLACTVGAMALAYR